MTTRTLRTLAAGVLAVATAFLVLPAVTADAATTTIRVTGTISDRGGYPLAGMTVQLVRADHEESDFAAVTSGRAGEFTTPKIPVDASTTYVLEVSDPTGRHRTAHSKEFAAVAANRRQNVTMADAALIRGKVSTKDGDLVRPAKSILVEAHGTTVGGQDADAFTFTSSRGGFVLGGLPGGTYTLTFTDYDEDGSRPGPRFSTICYDNVPITDVEPDRCDGSTLVRVAAGAVRTLHPQVMDHRLGGMTGTTTDASGTPVANATVTIVAADDAQHWLGETQTGADGSWSVQGITYVGKVKVKAEDGSGTYRTTWFTTAADFAHATALRLKDQGEIDDITIAMPRRK